MRIRELFEDKKFNETDYIKVNKNTHEINYDIIDDMVCYMSNDDNVYRKYVYPIVSNFKNDTSNNAYKLKPAVISAYENYIRKFPIKHLPDTLKNELCKKICEQLYEKLKKVK